MERPPPLWQLSTSTVTIWEREGVIHMSDVSTYGTD
jgi:hypothetical protein